MQAQVIYLTEDSFRDIIYREQDTDRYEFNKAIQILEAYEMGIISEGTLSDIISKVSGAIRKKIDFIKELASITGNKLKDLIAMFKNTKVFSILKAIKFSIKNLVSLLKKGFDTYVQIQDIIAQKIYELGGVRYIRKNLHKLDVFLNEHPVLKKISGVAVAGLLFFIWLNMSYDPVDVEWSLSFNDMLLALSGKFSLSELFASPAGIKMLTYLVIGMTTGGVWYYPGTQRSQIITGFLYSLYETFIKDKSIVIQPPKLKRKKI